MSATSGTCFTPEDHAVDMCLEHDAPQDVLRGWAAPQNSAEGQAQPSARVFLSCEERHRGRHVFRAAD